MTTPLTPERILQTGLAFWSAKTLLSAVEMGVFTELANGPEQFESLSGRLGLHARSARDFLDALVALGFLQRSGDVYSNTPDADLFLDRRKPSYIGGILEMANHRLYPFWGNLTEALRTGLPQNEAKAGGPGVFETLYADPARLKLFLAAMTGISRGANLAIAHKIPVGEIPHVRRRWYRRRVISRRRSRSPTRTCGASASTCPRSLRCSRSTSGRLGVADRLTFSSGSFFDHDLPKADVVLMGHILHDWDLPTKKMLIRKAFEAVPPGGALVVYETIIDDDRSKNAFGLMMSLNMLIETHGGFDYTGADCSAWMKEAGFSSTSVTPLGGPDSMVVGIR